MEFGVKIHMNEETFLMIFKQCQFLLCLVTPVRVVVAPVTWPWLQVRPATLGLVRQRTPDTGGECSWPLV